MNRRIRRRSSATDGYLRYLKPGALAKLRDSKINARNHRSFDAQICLNRVVVSSPLASPSRSPNGGGGGGGGGQQQQQEVVAGGVVGGDGGSPCFSMRFYGPRCPQRKKLMAARSMFFLNTNAASQTSDGPEPVIDAFTNDFLVAH